MTTAPTPRVPARRVSAPRQFEATQPVPFWGRLLLGTFLLALGTVLLYTLVMLWPALDPPPTVKGAPRELPIALFGDHVRIDPNEGLILVVVFTSAVGSFVHAATSFSDFVGNRKLAVSWTWWYLLRTAIGSSLALLFYFAVRGGFLTGNASSQTINPYGVAAISGLVGLFSKQATDKLREVFDTMFRVAPGAGDAARGDSASNPVPAIAGVEPRTVPVGTDLLELTLSGSGFVPESVVSVRHPDAVGARLLERTTTYVSETTLKMHLLREDVATACTLEIAVVNPPPGGGRAGPVPVEVSS